MAMDMFQLSKSLSIPLRTQRTGDSLDVRLSWLEIAPSATILGCHKAGHGSVPGSFTAEFGFWFCKRAVTVHLGGLIFPTRGLMWARWKEKDEAEKLKMYFLIIGRYKPTKICSKFTGTQKHIFHIQIEYYSNEMEHCKAHGRSIMDH